MREYGRKSLALAVTGIGLAMVGSGTPQSQELTSTIANNDSIFINGTTFTVTPGKAKGDVSGQIKALGARDLGPGAIIFRSGEKLYIVDAPLPLSNLVPEGGRNYYVTADSSTPDRVRIEYGPPKNPEHQKLYDLLKERRALERAKQILSPIRLPVDLTIRAQGCDGVVNAWYEREKSQPKVTICYEWLQEIMHSLPNETTPAGITPADAAFGQFLWIVTHETGHALFDIFNVPVFGREEDAADQFAAYIMLQFGQEQARRAIGGAAWMFKKYVDDYRKNPDVRLKLAGFASNHGQPEERFYNLMCMAYGAHPTLFRDLTENGWLPPSRAPSCKYEYRTLTNAFRQEIRPHIDQSMARLVMDTSWLPAEVSQPAQK
jgi:hypothetical protein